LERENKTVVLAFLGRIHEPSPALLSGDFELTVIGVGPSGARRTPAEVQALQQVTYAAADGDFAITPLRVIAEGDTVVVTANGRLPLKSGDVYANEYSFHFELRGGKIKKLTTYCDTAYARDTFPGF
jgi:ketosteroid isomerase-like protein